jgi:Fe-S-cluster containining protein
MSGYRRILQKADEQFRHVVATQPQNLQCGGGCSFCCYGLFEISGADVSVLADALRSLAPPARKALLARAAKIMSETAHPDIRDIDAEEKDDFFDRTAAVACPALDSGGMCTIYEHRPLMCRTFGLPVRDADRYIGDICDLNFTEATEEQKVSAAWDLQNEDPVNPEDQFTIPEALLIASRFLVDE